MYRIIGSDGKEYGPITAEVLMQWIEQGRINARTMARKEDSGEWLPLSSFPELSGMLASSAVRVPLAPPVPPGGSVDPTARAKEIISRGYQVDIGDCIGRGWALVKGDFWPIVGVNALLWVTMVLANLVYAGIVVNGPLLGGLYYFFLKRVRGQQSGVNEAFAGFSLAFLQLFLGQLVSGLLGGIGLILCLLPGIYLLVAWSFTLMLIVDKRMEFWPAMELSRQVVTAKWWSIFGLLIVSGLLNLAGMLALCVGVFVTAPIATAAMVYAYEDIFGVQKAPR
ncbi:MAG: DUF4339 domain-containing protein [Acidobacteria bacterium]|nr:DUF4339 domain-containing protein [Acidobacteriota bacterium]